ncbi:MAG: S9 family peptidase, partial [Eubacterium sp.]|nr:S9 family peptidase [Eubacterium sp.]
MNRKIEIEDINRYVIPSDLTYSPDGKVLAFNVKRADKKENKYHTDIHIIRDGKDIQLTQTLSSSFVLWDDDRHLILSRSADKEKEGITQLYRISIDGGEAVPWMDLMFPLLKLEKTRDGRYVACGIIRESEPDAYRYSLEEYRAKAEERKEEKDYLVAEETPFWFNGQGVTNDLRSALFLIDPKGKKPVRRITAPAFDVGSFISDGDMLYYTGSTRTRCLSLYNKLYAYSLSTGRRKILYGKNDRAFGDIFVWDGQLYAYSTDMKTYGVNETPNIYAVKEDGLSLVYKPSVTLYNSVLGDTVHAMGLPSCKGDTFYTLATVDDHTEIYAFDKDFRVHSIRQKPDMICEIAVSDDRIAVIWQDWCHVAEVLVMDRDGSNEHQITDLNGPLLEGRYIAQPKRIDYESEGEKLHGWILFPEGYSARKKYPAILDVHGGPRCAYGETFFHEMQAWAARGFVVFFTNTRGSDGRGDAFADIRGRYGSVDYRNLMDFTDAVLSACPNIDPKRLCVTGGSYGGFMTNWIITQTDRFCAAASQRSISNWISMTFVADIGLYFNPDQCGALTCFDFEKQWDCSP